MTFNPDDHTPDGDGGGKYLETAGRFVVVFTHYVKRDKTASEKSYLLFRAEVVDGEPAGNAGKKFSQRLFINTEAHGRLGAICAAMDLHQAIKLESDTDVDDQLGVRTAFMGRPFCAKMKVEPYDGNNYAKIAFAELDPTDDETGWINQWVEAAEERGFYDRLAEHSGEDSDNKPPPHNDDDIPF